MTDYPTFRLEAAGLTPLPLLFEQGYDVRRFDPGDATTRVVAEDAADADGTIDTTAYIGSRNVTLEVRLFPTVTDLWTLADSIRAFTHPRIRAFLYYQPSESLPERRIELRRSVFQDVIEENPLTTTVVAQWVAPYGVIESAEAVLATANASTLLVSSGRTYDLVFPRVYPASDPDGTAFVTNLGTMDAYPLLRLYGPCTDPAIENVTQGKGLEIEGLTILAGSFLEIDTRNKTIYLNGDPTVVHYDKLVAATSEWFTLSPGVNQIRYYPDSFSAPAQAEIEYRHTWL